jgi:hypothetical protein
VPASFLGESAPPAPQRQRAQEQEQEREQRQEQEQELRQRSASLAWRPLPSVQVRCELEQLSPRLSSVPNMPSGACV